ncbi:MAG: hypothetical protein Q8R47_00625 [Nanoarchaeota archaeon]|nr:hypothetical protein [Nanoarchaeota archaeon]
MILPKDKNDDIVNWGYDLFIGREIFEDGDEYVVTLNLQSQSSHSYSAHSYWSLRQACEELCDSVKEGKKVLLSQSPNRAGAKYAPFKSEQMDLLQRMYSERAEMKRFPDHFENQPYIH